MKTFGWYDFLRRHYLFSSLDREQIERLLTDEASEERKFSEGSVILREMEGDDSVFLIGLGSVQVVRRREDGQEIILSILKRDEFFGEMALFEHKARAATVKANENCILLEIKGPEFFEVMTKHPDFAFKVLSERLRHTNEQVVAMRMEDVDEKISIIDAKLTAELKAIDAKLTAADALFEQTKIRTDEVINSAEQRSTRLTTTVSAVGSVVGIAVVLFGWLGISEVLDIQGEADKIRVVKDEIEQVHTQAKQFRQDLGQFDSLRTNFYRQIMIPRVMAQLDDEKNFDPGETNKALEKILDTEEDDITASLFKDIQTKIFVKNRYISSILAKSLEYSIILRAPRQVISSYYLTVLNLIFNENYKEADVIFNHFEKYLDRYRGESVKDSLSKSLEYEEWLDFYSPSLNPKQKTEWKKLNKLIP